MAYEKGNQLKTSDRIASMRERKKEKEEKSQPPSKTSSNSVQILCPRDIFRTCQNLLCSTW